MDTFSRKQILLRVQWPKGSPEPTCRACQDPIEAGMQACRVNLGPGGNPMARALCLNGKPHEAVVGWVHWDCATGDRDNEHEQLERADGLKRQWLAEDHDALDCCSCQAKIVGGQSYALIPLGPGGDVELQDEAHTGRASAFLLCSLPAHWRCVTGDAEPEGDACALCRTALGEDKACHNPACDLNVGPA